MGKGRNGVKKKRRIGEKKKRGKGKKKKKRKKERGKDEKGKEDKEEKKKRETLGKADWCLVPIFLVELEPLEPLLNWRPCSSLLPS